MRSEFSECIPLRPVLRDVASVVQLWGTSENIRLQSVISLFRFVACFAVLQSCVRGKHGKFVSRGTQSTDGGVIACVGGSGVSCDRTTGSKCADAPSFFLRGRRNVGQDLVATFAVVAVSSQFVAKCACPVSG